MPVAFLGFLSIAALTWILSFHPRWYLHLVVPADDLWPVARWALGPEYSHTMRTMSVLQFFVACLVGIIDWWIR